MVRKLIVAVPDGYTIAAIADFSCRNGHLTVSAVELDGSTNTATVELRNGNSYEVAQSRFNGVALCVPTRFCV